jgi:hypothetical protein
MAIARTTTSDPSVQDFRFKLAGWLSILGAVLFYPAIIIAVIAISHKNLRPLLFLEIPLTAIGIAMHVYVFIQLKRLVNEMFFFHGINILIVAQIISIIVVGLKDIFVTILILMFYDADFVAPLDFILGIAGLIILGAVGIILGVGLLRIRDESAGMLRTFAIISIVASSCFVTVFLFPIAILVGLSNSVILGIVFFRAAETGTQVEFV